ncbi:MAG: TPM domain-containing protein, partial [Chloroflexi bacterium]|nr:TPM domain-containing protein [Chloroflexota bacterium]
KGKDNGVLVLLSIKERRWRIETGYGVEGILPDGLCGEIGRNYMVTYFKEGKYGEGLYKGVSAIADIIAKNAHVVLNTLSNFEEITSENQLSSSKSDGLGTLIIFIIIVLFIVISNLGVYRNRVPGVEVLVAAVAVVLGVLAAEVVAVVAPEADSRKEKK